MIRYYKDNLVPQELCRLLYETVPSHYHVPVRFHNRRQRDLHGQRGEYPLGSFRAARKGNSPHIDINLNTIYSEVTSGRNPYASAPSPALWRLLVEVCLHEFGHVATREQALHMNQHEYHGEPDYGRVYQATEQLAEEWKDRRIELILEEDPRLRQPRYIAGYLGARLTRWGSSARTEPGCFEFIMERRCQKTGGQLTAGDALRWLLDEPPGHYTNAYALLRNASEGIGIDYVDRAGRHHKLYRWGDLPLLAERFQRGDLRTSWRRDHQRRVEQGSRQDNPVSYLDSEILEDDW